MKTVNNILSEGMINILKTQIGKELVSFKYDYHFKDENTANSSGIVFNFENRNIILFSDIKYFDVLNGEDYSYIAVYDESFPEYDEIETYSRKKVVSVNQIVKDIQIVTDTYHCSNPEKKIDEEFICDYAIILVFDSFKICFEKFDIFENDLEIAKVDVVESFQFFDNSEDFENPDYYKTERQRNLKSLRS